MQSDEHIGRGGGLFVIPARRAEQGRPTSFIFGIIAAILLALGLAQPAHAADDRKSDAEKLRKLDIMLMVTSLRCRATAENFTEDYGRFTRRHLGELNQASRELRAELSARLGKKDAARTLDRISVIMANQYGGGHPWLTCGDLRQATRTLALMEGRATLVEAADQLLSVKPRPVLALAER